MTKAKAIRIPRSYQELREPPLETVHGGKYAIEFDVAPMSIAKQTILARQETVYDS